MELPESLRHRYTPIVPHPNQMVTLLNMGRALGIGAGWGGGKTTTLLAAAAQYADVPGYEAVIRRATLTDVRQAAGIDDVAKRWFRGHATRTAVANTVEWAFHDGGRITLVGGDWPAHLNDRVFQFAALDEAQEFSTRSAYTETEALLGHPDGDFGPAPDGTVLAEVPLRMRAAFSPVHEDGRVPPGAVWVHEMFFDRATRSVPVVPMTYRDNPAIDSGVYEEFNLPPERTRALARR